MPSTTTHWAPRGRRPPEPGSFESRRLGAIAAAIAAILLTATPARPGDPPLVDADVSIETSEGSLEVELLADCMPEAVKNFLAYVTDEAYDGTVIHFRRSQSDPGASPPSIVGGGAYSLFDPVPPSEIISFLLVPADDPIAVEPQGPEPQCPRNVRGTIGFIPGADDTVTSEWYINFEDNSAVTDPDVSSPPFGRIAAADLGVLDAIAAIPRASDLGIVIDPPFAQLPTSVAPGSGIVDIRVADTVTVQQVLIVPEPGAAALAAAALVALAGLRRGGRARARVAGR